MKVSLAITVKNENDVLKNNLLYHHFAGVGKAYIFDDGCTDGAVESVRHLPFVETCSSVDPEYFSDRGELAVLVEKAVAHHTARQALNVCFAMERAREAGFDWLVSIDADELVCTDLCHQQENGLQEFFGAMPPEIQTVRLKPLELVQRRTHYRNVFADETVFQRTGARVPRKLWDPYKKKVFKTNDFLGHTMGKTALRLSSRLVPKTVHKFVFPDGSKPENLGSGFLLHYNCYSADNFIKKFRNFKNHPDQYVTENNVEYLKLMWRDMVNDSQFTDSSLEEYFSKWIVISEKRVKKLMKKQFLGIFPRQPGLIHVPAVKDVMTHLSIS